jgi:hypothetical protein
LIKEFGSKQECCQSIGIGDKSLKKSLEKSLENKSFYNGYIYKFLEPKLKIF